MLQKANVSLGQTFSMFDDLEESLKLDGGKEGMISKPVDATDGKQSKMRAEELIPHVDSVSAASQAGRLVTQAGGSPWEVARATQEAAVKAGLDKESASVLAGEAAGRVVMAGGGTAEDAGRAAAKAAAAQGGSTQSQAAAAGMTVELAGGSAMEAAALAAEIAAALQDAERLTAEQSRPQLLSGDPIVPRSKSSLAYQASKVAAEPRERMTYNRGLPYDEVDLPGEERAVVSLPYSHATFLSSIEGQGRSSMPLYKDGGVLHRMNPLPHSSIGGGSSMGAMQKQPSIMSPPSLKSGTVTGLLHAGMTAEELSEVKFQVEELEQGAEMLRQAHSTLKQKMMGLSMEKQSWTRREQELLSARDEAVQGSKDLLIEIGHLAGSRLELKEKMEFWNTKEALMKKLQARDEEQNARVKELEVRLKEAEVGKAKTVEKEEENKIQESVETAQKAASETISEAQNKIEELSQKLLLAEAKDKEKEAEKTAVIEKEEEDTVIADRRVAKEERRLSISEGTLVADDTETEIALEAASTQLRASEKQLEKAQKKLTEAEEKTKEAEERAEIAERKLKTLRTVVNERAASPIRERSNSQSIQTPETEKAKQTTEWELKEAKLLGQLEQANQQKKELLKIVEEKAGAEMKLLSRTEEQNNNPDSAWNMQRDRMTVEIQQLKVELEEAHSFSEGDDQQRRGQAERFSEKLILILTLTLTLIPTLIGGSVKRRSG